MSDRVHLNKGERQMKMPGFTAENSLSAGLSFRKSEAAQRSSDGTGVVPQICRQQGSTIVCTDCFIYEGNDYCWTHTIRLPTLF
jgi:hypothetical protein